MAFQLFCQLPALFLSAAFQRANQLLTQPQTLLAFPALLSLMAVPTDLSVRLPDHIFRLLVGQVIFSVGHSIKSICQFLKCLGVFLHPLFLGLAQNLPGRQFLLFLPQR